jgi:hypothetical protein
MRGPLLIAVAALAAGCGTTTRGSPANVPRPVVSTPWPNTADYETIKTAVSARDDALFHEPDWRRKSFAASLASRSLLTVRMTAGSCATYVTELYGTLRDLIDAYPGEDWRPLLRVVRQQPSLASVCTPPTNYHVGFAV